MARETKADLKDRLNDCETELREARDLEAHWRKKYDEALALIDVEREAARRVHSFLIQVIHTLSEPRRD